MMCYVPNAFEQNAIVVYLAHRRLWIDKIWDTGRALAESIALQGFLGYLFDELSLFSLLPIVEIDLINLSFIEPFLAYTKFLKKSMGYFNFHFLLSRIFNCIVI